MMRISDTAALRPDFAARISKLKSLLEAESIPLHIFETARSPARQQELWNRGRMPDAPDFGRTVTSSLPFHSAHQYGLAVDWAFVIAGDWTWKEPREGLWNRFGELALQSNVHQLRDHSGDLIEENHVQMIPFNLSSMQRGPMDTAAWYQWLRRNNGA